jgi:hypothetical protein
MVQNEDSNHEFSDFDMEKDGEYEATKIEWATTLLLLLMNWRMGILSLCFFVTILCINAKQHSKMNG